MDRNTFCLVGAVLAASATGCGGTSGGISPASNAEVSTVDVLQTGATQGRAYVGVDNDVSVGAAPVVETMGLLGGSRLELEVVTPDGSPIEFEVWQSRLDGTALLQMAVDAPSGFALQDIAPTEDGTWIILFEGGVEPRKAIVHMDCVGGLNGCSEARQPGQTCPAGWACDVGLSCELPVGTCGPLAGIGTCVVAPTRCEESGASVCGCDGTTYASECDARVAGVPILYAAPCSE